MSNLNRILVGIRDSKLSRTQTNILLIEQKQMQTTNNTSNTKQQQKPNNNNNNINNSSSKRKNKKCERQYSYKSKIIQNQLNLKTILMIILMKLN